MTTYIFAALAIFMFLGIIKKLWGLVKFLIVAALAVAVLMYFNII